MSTYDLEIEAAGGDTTTTAATFVPVRMSRFSLTLRRRAPHTLSVDIPVASHHLLSDFVSGREWRLKRNGAHWQTGLMNAASLPGGEDGQSIRLEAWGSTYVLTMIPYFVNTFLAPGWDADGVIAQVLNDSDHGTIGDWFPAAGRTLTNGTFSLKTFTVAAQTKLAVIQQMCDVEGWEWRPGIDSAGAWTFKAGSSVNQDLTSSIKLFSPANCIIQSHAADGSRLVTAGEIGSRLPGASTRLNGAHSSGTSTLTVDNSNGFRQGQAIIIGDGTAAQETKTVSDVTGATTITLTANMVGNHSDNDIVKVSDPQTLLSASANAVDFTTLQQAHHGRGFKILDDSLTDDDRRSKLLTTMLTVYDHVQNQASLLIPGGDDVARYLDLGLHPGDTIKLTSAGKLGAVYDNTTVRVQEMTVMVNLDPNGGEAPETLSLAVSDPSLDALAVFEARLRTPLAAATTVYGG